MSLHLLDDLKGFIHQESGPQDGPPVIYLPGVHGDWTQMGEVRPILNQRFKLSEVTYPRVSAWRLEQFGEALGEMMDVLEIESAHIVGESFGSLVGWEFGLKHPSRVRSFILIGGFCQPPVKPRVALARWGLNVCPSSLFEKGIDTYLAYHRRNGRERTGLAEEFLPYVATRTVAGRRATVNRLAIIQTTDFRSEMHQVRFPVAYVGGGDDWVVPVRRELEFLDRTLHQDCRFEGEIVPRVPHAMLISHPRLTAEKIVDWVAKNE